MKRILVVLAFHFLVAIALDPMEKHGVVPDVIDKAPKETVEVSYPNGVKVDNGNTLTPTKVKDQPTLKWKTEEGTYYTVVMTDPDAPKRTDPKFREWHHWLIGNVLGNDVAKGDVLSEYIGAAPPKGSNLHRYVLLVYKQPTKLEFTENRLTNRSGANRGKFKIREFAKKYNLGEPIAGNFFQAEYDDYVPKIYKQLEG